jgi:hypothetical protein
MTAASEKAAGEWVKTEIAMPADGMNAAAERGSARPAGSSQTIYTSSPGMRKGRALNFCDAKVRSWPEPEVPESAVSGQKRK